MQLLSMILDGALPGLMATLLITVSAPLAASPAQETQPNVILVMADDQGWEEVGYNGHPDLRTPVLDEMARVGFRFDRFYAAAPNCGPTRGSVMTGRNSNRFGLFGPSYSMRPEEITIAEIAQNQGYATGHFGKWHLGPVKAGAPNNPGNSGFDEWLSHDNFFGIDPPLVRNGGTPEIHHGESSEILVREAIRFIRQSIDDQQPFFAVIWFGSVHGPYRALDADRRPYQHIQNDRLPDRYGEIAAIDRAVGRLRDALRDLQVQRNTILWYTSDNGVPHHSRFQPRLNGSKGNLFEGGIRVPAVIEWPDGIPEPRRSSVVSVTYDILPTLCELLQWPVPERVLDGISLAPSLAGMMDRRPRPALFWRYLSGDEVDNEPWMDPTTQKGTTPTPSNPGTQFRNFRHPVAQTDHRGDAAVIDGRYKLLVDSTGRHKTDERATAPVTEDVTLFDLERDPGETTNIAAANPERVARLMKDLRVWRDSVEQSLTGAEYAGQDGIGTDYEGGESIFGAGNGNPDGPDSGCGQPWGGERKGCGLGAELALLVPGLIGFGRRKSR